MVQEKPSVGILGYGFVGKATAELKTVATINIYDPYIDGHKSDEHLENALFSNFIICCVPTPEGEGGHVDLSILEQSVSAWVHYGCEGIFVIKSTIPAGTVDRLCEEYKTDKIIHNPEFLTERTHIEDFKNPTDVIIGGVKEHCEKLAKLYKDFYWDLNSGFDCVDINLCTAKEAELVKTVRNSFYATKVVFMNEIYQFCQKLEIDYSEYEKILTNNGKHPWWGPEHSKVPGPDGQLGFGGKCLIKDSIGLISLAEKGGLEMKVLKAAFEKNLDVRDHPDVAHHKKDSND